MNSVAFISKAKKVVLENLLNPQFGVEMMAKELGISRSELYKRIKAAENKSASQFIREIRLEKALELLNTGSYSIGEIAYMVGFNSPTYFSTSFKEYFGYSPSVSNQNGNVPESRKISKTKKRTIPIVLGAVAILILVFWSVGALGGTKTDEEIIIDLSVNRRTSLKAYRLYLEARELGEQRKDSSLPKAIGLLEEAVILDPSFAEAYAELSFLYGQWHYYGSLKKDVRDKMMKKYVDLAMGLDPESPEVLLAKADLAWKNRRFPDDSTTIITAFQSVLDRDSINARAHYRLYQVFSSLGRYETSHINLEKASALDPENYFYKIILARDLFWKWEEREKAQPMIEEVFQKSLRPEGVYFKALMTAESSAEGHVEAFKILHRATKNDRYLFGYLYWGYLIAMDLDLLPYAKKYSQLIQIRYPENTYYTYQPALDICIAEGRYDDALDLTIIWAENKGLDKMLAAEKIARIYYLKGDKSTAEQILLKNFADLFNNIAAGEHSSNLLNHGDIGPIMTYIDILRAKGERAKAQVFGDFLCSYYKDFDSRIIWDKFDPIDCYYLQEDTDSFLNAVRQAYFQNANRLGIYKDLKKLNYLSVEDNAEYRQLFAEIETEVHRMRAEVVVYLKEEGDWDPSWDKFLSNQTDTMAMQ
jgi:AraC-like DNA-binding protein